MLLRALAITAAACGILVGLAGPFSVHPDTLQDLLAAKDCAELGACAARGSVSRAGGLVNGAAFVHLLALGLPLGVGALWLAAWLLQGLAVGVLASRSLTAPALLLALLVALQAEPALWNPTLLPLPTALLTVALLRARGHAAAAAIGLLLWASVEAYTAALALMPAAAAVLALRSVPRAGVALAVCGAAMLLGSPAALGSAATGVGAAVVASLPFAVVAPWLLRERLRRVATDAHLLAVLVALPVLASAGMASAGLFEPRYLLPAAPAAAMLLPELCRSRLRWLPVAAAALVLAVALPGRAERLEGRAGAWTMPELERLGGVLAERGVPWSSLPGALQGPRCHQVLAGVALWLPLEEEHAPPRALQIVGPGDEPTLAPGRVALVEGCEDARCSPPRPLPLGWFGARDHPAVVPQDLAPDRWRLAVRPGPEVQLELSSLGRACAWHATAAPGDPPLPATSLPLPPGAEGEILLERVDPACGGDRLRVPPCWTERLP